MVTHLKNIERGFERVAKEEEQNDKEYAKLWYDHGARSGATASNADFDLIWRTEGEK